MTTFCVEAARDDNKNNISYIYIYIYIVLFSASPQTLGKCKERLATLQYVCISCMLRLLFPVIGRWWRPQSR